MALPRLFRSRRGTDGMEKEIEDFVDDLLVGLVRRRLEQVAVTAPHPVHQQHRTEHARGHGRVDVAEFTVTDTTLDDPCDEAELSLDDFPSVEAGEIRKVAQFRVDEAKEGGEI